ncbi:MAG TPA: TonB-dependent receptor [Gammaproteobacteria bacterium]|nr:TonB-dependent receptor [Gammaproteobacteria bacterium]
MVFVSFKRGMFSAAFSGLALALLSSQPALAQDDEDRAELGKVEVTGSRIRQVQIEGAQPILTITRQDIEESGLTSVGDLVQRLSIAGSAINTRFNSSGNFGFPPTGGGVGAGATEVDLRHLGSNRTLVLVDGVRWVNGSSASGVSAATDLNTIPLSIIERIEVLKDGASSIYGSDAIAGVVNIITRKDFEGLGLNVYAGAWDEGDGNTQSVDVSLGSTSDRTSVFVNASYTNQDRVGAGRRGQSSFPVPGTGVTRGSSGTPQGRFIFTDPNTGQTSDLTINDGVGGIPVYDPANPGGGTDDFHAFSNDDRFNFSPFNLLVTPSQRASVYGQASYAVADRVNFVVKGLYNNRRSTNQAAPEPIFLGPGAGSGGFADTVSIDATNPFNPFGFTLDASDNFILLGRRPLEGGPRIFDQDVDTYYFLGGLEGDFDLGEREYFWNVNYAFSRNSADQVTLGGYNIRKIAQALGPLDACNADPACVPLNLIGGQGADGMGSITPAMLNFIAYTQLDTSENELKDLTANITGDIVDLPAGPLAFAVGIEHREQEGFFQPDPVVVAGDTNGIPASPTAGGFDVDEYYGELIVPLLANQPGAELLDVEFSARNSDYSTFGSTTNVKASVRYKPTQALLFRGTFAEGFRAPSIGELFGTATRFDAVLADPCTDFNNSGVSQATIDNCIALGVPADGSYLQVNPQISVVTGGNPALEPEESDSLSFGAVYSPEWVRNVNWIDSLDLELTYYDHEIDGAITAVDAQGQLDSCVMTLDPGFCNGINRNASGAIAGFSNRLTNIGGIETSGYDFVLTYRGPETGIGQFGLQWQTTYVHEYVEIILDPTSPSGFSDDPLDGIERNDSAIPQIKSNASVSWNLGNWGAAYTARYIKDVEESCSDFLDGTPNSLTNLGLCSNPNMDNALSTNKLGSTVYHDVQVSFGPPQIQNLQLTLGILNLTDKDPPVCLSCSLNGYDPSTYDIPGRFGYIRASFGL